MIHTKLNINIFRAILQFALKDQKNTLFTN